MARLVIVGGGVAGLACLNALLDAGISALLLEAGTIGSPKLCGEFLAPTALQQLEKWGIGSIQSIKQASFLLNQNCLDLSFKKPAGAYARSDLELQLAERARRLGGQILEKTSIVNVTPATASTPFMFQLATGDILPAETAIFATGKLTQNRSQRLPYYGLKLHFPQVIKPETLLMYSLPGAYLGIVPISGTSSNCAGLIRRDVVEKFGSGKQFFSHLVHTQPRLQSVFARIDVDGLVYLEGLAPEFGLRKTPDWPNALWIGDALASLPPAIGYGFAHSVESAVMAVECYLQNNHQRFRQAATQLIMPKLRVGKILHRVLMNPLWGSFGMPFLRSSPWAVRMLMQKVGYV